MLIYVACKECGWCELVEAHSVHTYLDKFDCEMGMWKNRRGPGQRRCDSFATPDQVKEMKRLEGKEW